MTDANPPFLPFARPDIGDAEVEAVARALRSGWVTTGPETRAFEQEFAACLGGGVHAVAVNSATAGLHLALESIGVGAGDEVIAPTLTFTATVEVARYLGADAVLVDVDRSPTSPGGHRRRHHARAPSCRCTTAVWPATWTRSSRWHATACRWSRMPRTRCATHGGRLVGSLPSAASVFSFYANKTITTGEAAWW